MEGQQAADIDLDATVRFFNSTSVGGWIPPRPQATGSETQTLAILFSLGLQEAPRLFTEMFFCLNLPHILSWGDGVRAWRTFLENEVNVVRC